MRSSVSRHTAAARTDTLNHGGARSYRASACPPRRWPAGSDPARLRYRAGTHHRPPARRSSRSNSAAAREADLHKRDPVRVVNQPNPGLNCTLRMYQPNVEALYLT